MTTANKITILRILLVPFFIVLMHSYVTSGDEVFRLGALLVFTIASISDGVDGYIARRYNQRSELGAILDPLADKLLLVSAIILLSLNTNGYFAKIPVWLIAIVLTRDVLLVLGIVVIHYTVGKAKVRPRIVGKIASVLQMIVVIWIILKWNLHTLWWLEASAAALTTLCGLLYLWDWMRQIGESPASAPSKE